jgi:UDP-N-acetyl-D-galactosamine dehydrogenase
MKKKILVVGLGYVGIHILYKLNEKKFNVSGYDKSKKKINNLKDKIDSTLQYKNINFDNKKLFSKIPRKFKFDIVILCLPTPLKNNKPDLSYLDDAFKKIKYNLENQAIILNESTVYPGTTRMLAIKNIQKKDFILNKDFYIAYSPERISPGDKIRFSNINKVLSVSHNSIYKTVYLIYRKILNKKIIKANSIEAAETVKILENSQRDLNIALINQFVPLFQKLNLNTEEILKLASTKWNFYNVIPGLVGGQCIPIDPQYAISVAQKNNINLSLLKLSRNVNESLKNSILKKITKKLQKNIYKKIIFFGVVYKNNTSDYKYAKEFEIFEKIDKKFNTDFYDENVKIIKSNNRSKKRINLKNINKYTSIVLTNSISNKLFKTIEKKLLNKKNRYILNLSRYNLDKNLIKLNYIDEPLK